MNNFEQFWNVYPNRKGKKAAEKAFDKACEGEDRDEFTKMVLLAIEAQKRYRLEAQGSGEFIPQWKMPATWLNSGCWDDEVKSHAELKERAKLQLCSEPGCPYPVHGPKFSRCTEHEGRKKDGSMYDAMRDYYREHDLGNKTREQMIQMIKETSARIGK